MRTKNFVSLRLFNSLGVDASAEAFDRVESEDELIKSLDLANRQKQSILVLGAGTNIVLANNYSGRVIHQCSRGIRLLGSSMDKVYIRACAGENWHQFVMWTISNKCYGLENLALIPGNVGAAPVQNIGAFGVEVKSFITKVNCIRVADGKPFTLDHAGCGFSYRDSVFKQEMLDKLVIVSLDLALSRVPEPIIVYPLLIDSMREMNMRETPEGILEAVIKLRSNRLPDPVKIPNVGSFFKNPIVSQSRAAYLQQRFPDMPINSHNEDSIKLSAGWMIEHCGWKGYESDGLGISANHALVLINRKAASGSSVMEFAEKVKFSVFREFGFELEIEPRVI